MRVECGFVFTEDNGDSIIPETVVKQGQQTKEQHVKTYISLV